MVEGRWTLRAIRGHGLRGLQACAMSVCRADSNDVRIISRGADGGIPIRAGAVVFAHVASGDDDDDTGLPCGFDSLAERVLRVAFEHAASEREIHHADVVSALQRNGL